MIENYPNQRRMNCETGMLVNMLQYYGYEMSEQMAFGLGGGLCFVYMPFIKTPEGYIFPLLRMKPITIFRKVCQRLHLDYHEETFGNNEQKGAAALDALVAKNVPVGVQVNIGALDYVNKFDEFRSYMGTGNSGAMNFNGHAVCVIGENGSEYIFSDTDFRIPDEYVTLDKAAMTKARFLPGSFTPHGRMVYLGPSDKDAMRPEYLKQAIIAGMKETCHIMLKWYHPYVGCNGLHFFAKDIRSWHKKFNKEQINGRLLKYYRWIELGGTGGSAHRGMYSDFLKESAVIFQDNILNDCASSMSIAADDWRQFAVDCGRFMKQGSITLEEMADVMDEIGDAEYKTFKKIKKEFLKKQ